MMNLKMIINTSATKSPENLREILKLSSKEITANILAQEIESSPNLKKINLYCCENLNNEIPDNLNNIEELDLSRSNITIDTVAKIIKNNPNLKGITANDTFCTFEAY